MSKFGLDLFGHHSWGKVYETGQHLVDLHHLLLVMLDGIQPMKLQNFGMELSGLLLVLVHRQNLARFYLLALVREPGRFLKV
jgi:hypothetical protein